MEQSFDETPGDGYLITGLRTVASDSSSPAILKLDGLGNVLWNKTYHLNKPHAFHIASYVDPEGRTLLGFHADSTLNAISDNCILTKVAADGTTLWSRRIDGIEGRITGCAKDGGQYTVSLEDSTSIYLLKLDTAGVPLWGKRYVYPFSWSTWGGGIISTLDHGYVLRKLVSDGSGWNTFFFKVNSEGEIQWERSYGWGYQFPIDLVQNPDSTLTLLTYGQGFYLSGMDPTGMNVCMTPVTGILTEMPVPYSLAAITLDEFEALMSSESLYLGDSIATNPVMVDTCQFVAGVPEHSGLVTLQVYPNPTNGSLTARINSDLLGSKLLLFDQLGREVLSLILSSLENIIPFEEQPAGLYLYQVVTPKGNMLSGRLIKN